MAENISRDVWNVIDHDAALKLDLSRGIVNVRALARVIAKQLEVRTTEEAIVSAIRRYPISGKPLAPLDKATSVARQSEISTRSKIVNIALVKDKEIQENLEKAFSIINFDRGEVLRMVQGDESIKVMVNEKNLKKLLEIFPRNKIIHVQKNLAEINLRLHPEAVSTPGIILVFTTELARNGINMVEVMSCVPEMMIFVEEKDALKAYETLFKFCQHSA